ncbi:MAG: tetratricopeptide repeat protein [Methylococcales bacterium]|nr:tetratricopeptide repeat protein [Methylococcales bacterium]
MPQADVLLITVTKTESRAVLQCFETLSNSKAKPIHIDKRVYFDLGEINGAAVYLTQSAMGTAALDASLQAVTKGIEALQPTAVIMVGIAFGINDEKQAIGDVLIAEQLQPYESQRVGDKIILRADRPHSAPWLLNLCRSAELMWGGATLRFGVVLSGEKLVDNKAFRDQLLELAPEAIGGEMEGAGLYAACHDKKIDWLLVKAVCDFADGNKGKDKDKNQQLAANNAADFVLHCLQFVTIDWQALRQQHAKQIATATNNSTAINAQAETINIFHNHSDPIKTSSNIPHQQYFFGRDDELKTIADALLPTTRTWGVLIDGEGGIGKTALAIRAATLASKQTFPRKVFVSAKVRELQPDGEQPLKDFMLPNFIALISAMARHLGNERIEQLPENQRADSVNHSLTEQATLLVIDNLETFNEPEQRRLYQFLERLPLNAKAIVTSRRRTDIDARIIRLARLDKTAALALLAALAQKNRYLAAATDDDKTALYEQTRGNPLLLTWTAAQLGRKGGHCQTIAQACSFIQLAPKHNDPLAYIFADLLDNLRDNEKAVLIALSYFTHPAHLAWLAELGNLNENVALTALEDLNDRALVISDEAANSFYLPPYTAAFLRRHCPDLLTATSSRLTDKAYALIMENGYQKYERFAELEQHWSLIAASLPEFLHDENQRLQTVCDALDKFLEFSGRWDVWLTLSEQAEPKALAAQDFYNAGWRAYRAGWVYYLRGQSESVLACAERCGQHWQQGKAGSREMATTIRLRGLGHQLAKQYALAIDDYQQALNLYKSIEAESVDVAIALNTLASVQKGLGDSMAAEANYREALRIATKIKASSGVATYTSNLAGLMLAREDWQQAESLARDALALSEAVGRLELIAWDCRILAQALAQQNRQDEGLPYAERAVYIFSKLGQAEKLAEAQQTLLACRLP